MNSLTVFAPAKINLFLAITGRRPDGFHDLLSVVAPLEFGDDLVITPTTGSTYSLRCDDPAVPLDETNLVLKAASLFTSATGIKTGAEFLLRKRVPIGAGLGGGSSDGTAALIGLNQLAGSPLGVSELTALASQLGSDCVLFLYGRPSVMRGRGERIEALPDPATMRLSGRRLLIFKPSFGIQTAWAYRQMAADAPAGYVSEATAEQRLTVWMQSPGATAEDLVFNNMESVAFRKFIALPTLLDQLKWRFGLTVGMSGSGSACFALLAEKEDVSVIKSAIQEAWGEEAVVVETRTR